MTYKPLTIVATVKAETKRGKKIVKRYQLVADQSRSGKIVLRLGPEIKKKK